MAPLIGLIVFVIAIFASRVIMSRALRRLNDEQKLGLLNAFSDRSLVSTAILMVLLIAFVATFYFSHEFGVFEFTIFFLLFLLCMCYTSIRNYQKLQRLSMPREYVNNYLISACFVLCGLIAMAALIVYSLFYR